VGVFRSRGQTVAAAGAAGLAASLWLPWYIVSPGASARQLGALGLRLSAAAPVGAAHLTAWQVFDTTPLVLLVAAIIGGGPAVLALTNRTGSGAQLTLLAGAVAAPLVGYRIAFPPGPGGFVHPGWGIYLALVSALAMVAGGALAQAEDEDAPIIAGADWPSVAATGARTPKL
jgi:hypothetical protein